MRVKINHRRQIWDILVRFRATPKLGCQAALRTWTPKYWIDQIIILDILLVNYITCKAIAKKDIHRKISNVPIKYFFKQYVPSISWLNGRQKSILKAILFKLKSNKIYVLWKDELSIDNQQWFTQLHLWLQTFPKTGGWTLPNAHCFTHS